MNSKRNAKRAVLVAMLVAGVAAVGCSNVDVDEDATPTTDESSSAFSPAVTKVDAGKGPKHCEARLDPTSPPEYPRYTCSYGGEQIAICAGPLVVIAKDACVGGCAVTCQKICNKYASFPVR